MYSLRCPTCRGLDWYRNGFAIGEDDEGTIEAARVEPGPLDAEAAWSCMRCGHEAPGWTQLAKSLAAVEAARAAGAEALSDVLSRVS